MSRSPSDTAAVLREGFFTTNRLFWREAMTYEAAERGPGNRANPAAAALDQAYAAFAALIGQDEIVHAVAERSAALEDTPSYRWVVYTSTTVLYSTFHAKSVGSIRVDSFPRRRIDQLSVTKAPATYLDEQTTDLAFSALYTNGIGFSFSFHADPIGSHDQKDHAAWLYKLLEVLKEDLAQAS